MGVAFKQGHLGRRQRKLQPALGLGSRHRTVQEGGTATEGQQQGALAAQQPQRREDLVGVVQAQVDVHAGGHHPGAIGPLDDGVIVIAGV